MSSTLSAADLQRRHELEGAPDPFPSLSGGNPQPRSSSARGNGNADIDSTLSFPALGNATPIKPVSSWGSAPRVQASPASKATGQQTLVLPSVDLSQLAGRGKAPTLLDYQKTVGSKFKVQISSVQQRTTGQTTFTIKGDSEKDIAKARKHLLATLSPLVTLRISAPNSTLPSIIGPGGATIKGIRDKTNARIDVPRRDIPEQDTTPSANEDDDEPCTVITVVAPQPLALEAKGFIEDIIASKKAKSTQRIRDVPTHILPFLLPRRQEFLSAAGAIGDVNLNLDRPTNTIIVTGDREAVKAVVEKINLATDSLKSSLTPLKLPLPKKQHRLLTPHVIAEIISKARCSVTVPSIDDPSNEITIWGVVSQGTDISSGIATVLQTVNSQHTQEFIIPSSVARCAVIYIVRTGFIKQLQAQNPKVSVYLPSGVQLKKQGLPAIIDLVGDKAAVENAIASLSELITNLLNGSREIGIDYLLHGSVQKKAGKKLKQFQDNEKVLVYFPDAKEESSVVFLILDPTSSDQMDKARCLSLVEEELQTLAKSCGTLKSQTLHIGQKWHESIRGKDGTTLNALVGEGRILSIKLGADVEDVAGGSGENVIFIRGLSADVDNAVNEIQRIVAAAENNEIDDSYNLEFEIPKDYVGRIVGAGGVGINKLRNELGVKLDFVDDIEDKDREAVPKKKRNVANSNQKASVKISGRRENVEEAKRRIHNQVERIADESSEVLKIPHEYHASLIGSSGKYVIRLEEKYSVKITFPRDNGEGDPRTREPLKADEVLVKGGKKGVAGAKSELLEALEFEKESNNTLSFTIPTRAVARVLGKGGVTINDIKDDSGAQIDIDRGAGDQTKVTVKGTKKSITAAKAAILEIADQVGEEVTQTLKIENKYHRTIIGAGGQGLKELIARCGGPADSRAQANLVHFPRQGETSDEIQLRGDPALVKRIRAEFEKVITSIKERVVLGVGIPSAQHKIFIGRGGQALNELQNRSGVQVQFPGSRSYGSVGEPINQSELEGVAPTDLVKIQGPRSACEKVIEELKSKIRTPSEPKSAQPQDAQVEIQVSVPIKYQHVILQQGALSRQLRAVGALLVQSEDAPKDTSAHFEARIDDEIPAPGENLWRVSPNYHEGQDGSSDWTIKARDQEGLDRGQKLLLEAIKHAEGISHVGQLTLPNRNAFPRIVGSKGATVARLRAETGADIIVSRSDNTITIKGSEQAVEDAKEAVLLIVNGSGRGKAD